MPTHDEKNSSLNVIYKLARDSFTHYLSNILIYTSIIIKEFESPR